MVSPKAKRLCKELLMDNYIFIHQNPLQMNKMIKTFTILLIVCLLCLASTENKAQTQAGNKCKCEVNFTFFFLDIEIYSSWLTYSGDCCAGIHGEIRTWATINHEPVDYRFSYAWCCAENKIMV